MHHSTRSVVTGSTEWTEQMERQKNKLTPQDKGPEAIRSIVIRCAIYLQVNCKTKHEITKSFEGE